MEVISVYSVLHDFYGLSREIDGKNPKKDQKNNQLRVKNFQVLRSFFSNVEVCFDEEVKPEYRQSVDSFFQKLQSRPLDHIEIMAAIEHLEHHLDELRENINYPKSFSILKRYEFHK